MWVEHVNIVSRQKARAAECSFKKATQENVIYVQFYVDVLNYLFYVINVTILWAGAWTFPLLCFCHIDDNTGSQSENETVKNVSCFCEKEEYGQAITLA